VIADHSGFIGDEEVYARLKQVNTEDGSEVYRWVDPKLNLDNYNSVLIEDVTFFPAPQPNEQVSKEALDDITTYTTLLLKRKIGDVIPLAEAPGPGVLLIQPAITGVAIKTQGMKPYEILPVAAVFGVAKAATGNRAQDVYVRSEVKFIDSNSGELMGAAVRRIDGERLKGKKDQLELEDMQMNLDHSTTEAATFMEQVVTE
ncbi:MAG: DUF3313 domain-containing protein, partial [Pseudomonadota bacterium]